MWITLWRSRYRQMDADPLCGAVPKGVPARRAVLRQGRAHQRDRRRDGLRIARARDQSGTHAGNLPTCLAAGERRR